ncbi:MAG: hypothetical protein ABJN26_25215 [Stappiaceae bacterium]
MTLHTFIKLIGLALLATAIQPSAYAQQGASPSEFAPKQYPREVARNAKVGFSWHPQTHRVTVSLATGCLATSARNLRDTFSLSVDRKAKVLRIDGDYWYTRRSRISTRDCMQSTTRHLSVSALDYGDYRIEYKGKAIWVGELGSNAVKQNYSRFGHHKQRPYRTADE